ncbi:hypothetical protein [Coleofasciculus sp. FACHB-129]|uniref:hypothetical protein n=1 Tax=Cyanophyceae TaxID=3028117 RepID=UPI001684B71E|nr:hypothetical protein [Coleofasciculus sp. FACHB-129]MBD1895506.1 hypothetical protein [Coleofasciculus sp. FACHB-129]
MGNCFRGVALPDKWLASITQRLAELVFITGQLVQPTLQQGQNIEVLTAGVGQALEEITTL